MIRSTKFWTMMVLFQVAFGLTVFAITRHYYLDEAPAVSTSQTTPAQGSPQWPQSGEENDLANLISSFPGQATITDPAAASSQADEYFANRQFDKAAELYQGLIDAGFNAPDTYNNLGITLHYLGRSTDALSVLNEGAAIDPNYQRIWLTLGFVNSQAGQIEQARLALGTAVSMGADTEVGQSAKSLLDELGPG